MSNKQNDIREISELFWQFHNDRLANPELTDMTPYIKPILDSHKASTDKAVREARLEQAKRITVGGRGGTGVFIENTPIEHYIANLKPQETE